MKKKPGKFEIAGKNEVGYCNPGAIFSLFSPFKNPLEFWLGAVYTNRISSMSRAPFRGERVKAISIPRSPTTKNTALPQLNRLQNPLAGASSPHVRIADEASPIWRFIFCYSMPRDLAVGFLKNWSTRRSFSQLDSESLGKCMGWCELQWASSYAMSHK